MAADSLQRGYSSVAPFFTFGGFPGCFKMGSIQKGSPHFWRVETKSVAFWGFEGTRIAAITLVLVLQLHSPPLSFLHLSHQLSFGPF